jgi:hypothetical protein
VADASTIQRSIATIEALSRRCCDRINMATDPHHVADWQLHHAVLHADWHRLHDRLDDAEARTRGGRS